MLFGGGEGLRRKGERGDLLICIFYFAVSPGHTVATLTEDTHILPRTQMDNRGFFSVGNEDSFDDFIAFINENMHMHVSLCQKIFAKTFRYYLCQIS